MKRVLLTRAREDAERTAEKLRRLGFEPLISPAIEIVATGAPLPPAAFDAGLATSARAIECAGPGLAAFSPLPFYVVGQRTAQASMRAGLTVEAIAPEVTTLISALRDSPLPHPPPLRGRGDSNAAPIREGGTSSLSRERRRVGGGAEPRRFLYLAGRDRKDDLERALREQGHEITTVEVYEARAAQRLSDEAKAALAAGDIAAVLHYSPRSAAIFLELAKGAPSLRGAKRRSNPEAPAAPGLLRSPRNDGVIHLALSEEVARPLREAGCRRVMVATSPDEDRLLALLPPA